ncbi:MAG TPA: hypothetical protein VN454_03530 [Candidatus Angelobacter sp.]|nr:hypothetical protein [Candidatus Angelobacter sp.]
MTFAARLPGYKLYDALKDSAFRMGVCVGLCLFAVFAAWLVVANRFSMFDRLAMERNIVAAGAMILLAALPILRFIRRPGSLLGSGLTAWAIFSFLYRVICLFFERLSSWHGAWQVFVAGMVLYLIAATVAWIVGLVWRVRASHSGSRENHQLT